jgi:two-component system chemotaxis response regulator CheB
MTSWNQNRDPGAADSIACSRFAVIGIAASACGIEPLHQLIRALPADFPCPVIVVQHLPASTQYRSTLDRVLAYRSTLTVKWAEHAEPLRPGVVLLAPQDCDLEISPNRAVKLLHGDRVNHVRPAADPLFASIAWNFGDAGVAVVLSGALNDGARGVCDIALAGGSVIVQERETAGMPYMPAAAINTGAVDFVLPPRMIAHALITLVMAPGAAAWFRVGRVKALAPPGHAALRRPSTAHRR